MPSVTIVVPSLVRGGMTRAYVLSAGLERLGCSVDIVGSLPPGGAVYPEPRSGVCVHAVPEGAFPRVVRAVRERITGDVIYAVKPKPTSFGISLIDRLRSGRRIIVDIDDWDTKFRDRPRQQGSRAVLRAQLRRARRLPRRLSNPDYRPYVRWTERLVPLADAVTSNTRFLQERFGGVYVPSAKDTDQFDPERFDAEDARAWLGLSGYRVLMFPGTAREHKGLEDVLAAMDILGWPDLRLVVVGGRETGDAYVTGLESRWPGRIIRLSRYGMEDMPRVVAAAHIVVATQRETVAARAQFPMKLTDAMAMAKPVIATRVGDIPEILEGAACVVPPESPADIAAAITELFDDPMAAAAMGSRARARCVASYSIGAVAEALRPVLRGLGVA